MQSLSPHPSWSKAAPGSARAQDMLCRAHGEGHTEGENHSLSGRKPWLTMPLSSTAAHTRKGGLKSFKKPTFSGLWVLVHRSAALLSTSPKGKFLSPQLSRAPVSGLTPPGIPPQCGTGCAAGQAAACLDTFVVSAHVVGEAVCASSLIQQAWLWGVGTTQRHCLWGGEERGGSLNTWNPSFTHHYTLLLVSRCEPGPVLEQRLQVKAGLQRASPQERHRKASGCAFCLYGFFLPMKSETRAYCHDPPQHQPTHRGLYQTLKQA